jgi:hypothetical protein
MSDAKKKMRGAGSSASGTVPATPEFHAESVVNETEHTSIPCAVRKERLTGARIVPLRPSSGNPLLHEQEKQSLAYWLRKQATFPPFAQPWFDQGYHYAGISDFVLQHGGWYVPVPFPAGIRKARARQCFLNSAITAVEQDGYKYVEGYALPYGQTPVHHAWNLDPDGNLFDRTWKNGGAAYLGVVFSTKLVCGFPDRLPCVLSRPEMFRKPWTGEGQSSQLDGSQDIVAIPRGPE